MSELLNEHRGQGPFDPQRLVAHLPEFTPGATASAPAAVDYLRYYQLDFSARVKGLSHHMGTLMSGRHQIVAQHFRQPGARGTVVVCHGYYDHVGLYGHLLEFMLRLGFDVLAFDQPGHGLSSGDMATIDSFDEYVCALADTLDRAGPELAKPWHIIGQSMGGAITMEFLVQHGVRGFDHVMLLAPLVRPAQWGLSRLVYAVARRTIKERPRKLTMNAENPEFLQLLAIDPLSPRTLPVAWVTAMVEWMKRFESYKALPFKPMIVQGHADQTVDWKYNLRLLRRMTEPEVLEIPQARHHLVNESSAIREQAFAWLGSRLVDGKPG